ncbi:hypothetical protein ACF3NG_02165 [Aerococcaceae bacterium WGS1372]
MSDLSFTDDERYKELAKFLKKAVLTNTLFQDGTQINSVPKHVSDSFFNARIVTEFDIEQMKDIFNEVLEEYEGTDDEELSLEMLLDLGPMVTNPDNNLVKLAKEIGETHLKGGL